MLLLLRLCLKVSHLIKKQAALERLKYDFLTFYLTILELFIKRNLHL
jgi:hypothetical protein